MGENPGGQFKNYSCAYSFNRNEKLKNSCPGYDNRYNSLSKYTQKLKSYLCS